MEKAIVEKEEDLNKKKEIVQSTQQHKEKDQQISKKRKLSQDA